MKWTNWFNLLKPVQVAYAKDHTIKENIDQFKNGSMSYQNALTNIMEIAGIGPSDAQNILNTGKVPSGINERSTIRDAQGNRKYSGQDAYAPGGGPGAESGSGVSSDPEAAIYGRGGGANLPPVRPNYKVNARNMPSNFFGGLKVGDVVTVNPTGGVQIVENGAFQRTGGYGGGYSQPDLSGGVARRVQGFGYSPNGVAQIFFTDGTIAQDRQDPQGGSNLKASLSGAAGGGGAAAGAGAGGAGGGAMGGAPTLGGQPPTFAGSPQEAAALSAQFNLPPPPTLEDLFGTGVARTAQFQQGLENRIGGANINPNFRGFMENQLDAANQAFLMRGLHGGTTNFGDFTQSLQGQSPSGQDRARGFGVMPTEATLRSTANLLNTPPGQINFLNPDPSLLLREQLRGDPLGQFNMATAGSSLGLPARMRGTFDTLARRSFNNVLAQQGEQPNFQFLPFLAQNNFRLGL